ncbi:hypothetical protein [Hominenteromicrobium sp.]|uniref:hypothetical protein n=1 Tax=Hominenteromicrobium sp. TaxID=3073581 RepID=UPI00399B0251
MAETGAFTVLEKPGEDLEKLGEREVRRRLLLTGEVRGLHAAGGSQEYSPHLRRTTAQCVYDATWNAQSRSGSGIMPGDKFGLYAAPASSP